MFLIISVSLLRSTILWNDICFLQLPLSLYFRMLFLAICFLHSNYLVILCNKFFLWGYPLQERVTCLGIAPWSISSHSGLWIMDSERRKERVGCAGIEQLYNCPYSLPVGNFHCMEQRGEFKSNPVFSQSWGSSGRYLEPPKNVLSTWKKRAAKLHKPSNPPVSTPLTPQSQVRNTQSTDLQMKKS